GLQAAAIVGELAEALVEGMLLLFDYGYARERLYASWRREGTLMTFRRHTPGEDPYRHVGEQDLTCHVDLDAVEAAAVQAGLTPYARVSQAEWLAAVGVLSGELPSGGAAAELETYLSRRRGSETLSDPAGLGRIQVMAFGRGGAIVAPGLETR
ncbi:MAG: SAM-dependent methyltransferase, partial [Chloroflexi bacterium]|nr:SAM-dependent methyltransferase [Chloroflexota bacterium]